MTLEILGNIYLTQGNLEKARNTFEMACPLIELIETPYQSQDALKSPFDTHVTFPQTQREMDQCRNCLNQLKSVYKQLRNTATSPSTIIGEDDFKNLRDPYKRLRADIDLRKFLMDLLVTIDLDDLTFLQVRNKVLDEVQDFIRGYIEDFGGNTPPLLEIFEQVFQAIPDKLPRMSATRLHDLLDECMDIMLKESWENTSLYLRTHSAVDFCNADELDNDTPSLAPVPGASSSSSLEQVMRDAASQPLQSSSLLNFMAKQSGDILAKASVVNEPTTDKLTACIKSGREESDCIDKYFVPATKFTIGESLPSNGRPGFIPGTSEPVFDKDGVISPRMLDYLRDFALKKNPSLVQSDPMSDIGTDKRSKSISQRRKAGLKKRLKRMKREGNFDDIGKKEMVREESGYDIDVNDSLGNFADTFTDDGFLSNSIVEKQSSNDSGNTRGEFSKKPTPVVRNITANEPPASLQMNLVFWQWVRMQPPQPTPLATVKVESPSPVKGSPSNSPSSASLRNDLRLKSEEAGVLFESSTTAGQNTAPRAAVSNVRANNTAVFAIVFCVIALSLGVVYLNYVQHTSSSLRRKPKRTPKRTLGQYVEDTFNYILQFSEEVAYPFFCYLLKQLVDLSLSGASKLCKLLYRRILSIVGFGVKESNGKNIVNSTKLGSGVSSRTAQGTASGGSSSAMKKGTLSSSNINANVGHQKSSSKANTTDKAPTANTISNISTKRNSPRSSTAAPVAPSSEKGDGAPSGSSDKRIRFEIPPSDENSIGKTVVVPHSSSSSSGGKNNVEKTKKAKKLNMHDLNQSETSSSTHPKFATKQTVDSTSVRTTASASSTSKAPSTKKRPDQNTAESTKKVSPNSVALACPTSSVAATTANKKVSKQKNSPTSENLAGASAKKTRDKVNDHENVKKQEDIKSKVTKKSDSLSPRSIKGEQSTDSYDDLLQRIKHTTVDSISIDEAEEDSKVDQAINTDKCIKNDRKKPKGVKEKAGKKSIPFPSPILIGSTPHVPLPPTCDISPHSGLRIAPGISSELFSGKNVVQSTGTTSTGVSPKSLTAPITVSSPLAMPLQSSPSAITSAVPTLEDAPTEIAPGLSLSMLPASVGKVSSSDGIVDGSHNSSMDNKKCDTSGDVIANKGGDGLLRSLLVGLGERTDVWENSAPSTLRGLGLSAEEGISVNPSNKLDMDDDADSMFPLPRSVFDELYAGGGMGMGMGISAASSSSSSDGKTLSSTMDIGKVNRVDDVSFHEIFSDLNKDSPEFHSARYPSLALQSHEEENGLPFSSYAGSERLVTGLSLLGDRESDMKRIMDTEFSFFGSNDAHHDDNLQTQNGHHHETSIDELWRKNMNSEMLLGSSLIDDIDDSDFFPCNQGIGSDLFQDDTVDYEGLLSHQNDNVIHSTNFLGQQTGEGFAPPGFIANHPNNNANVGAGGPQSMLPFDTHDSGVIGQSTQLPPSHVGTSQPHQNYLSSDQDMIGKNDIVTLTFTVRCSFGFRQKINVDSVRMASSLFGRWSLDHSLPMRRSMGDADVFGLNVEVPAYLPHFAFKYVITDVDGKMWVERGGPVVMDVGHRLQQEQLQRQRANIHDPTMDLTKSIVLDQDDIIRSCVSVPPGPYLYGSNE